LTIQSNGNSILIFQNWNSISYKQSEAHDVLETNTVLHKGPVEIKESKYNQVDKAYVASQQKHLSPQQ